MPKVVLFVNVENDGVGDFYHLADIYYALSKNPNLRDYEFIPIIGYGTAHSKKTIESFRNVLNKLNVINYFLYPAFREVYEIFGPLPGYGDPNVNSYFIGSNSEFEKNALIQQNLRESSQIIVISSRSSLNVNFERYAAENAVYTFIGEHEWNNPVAGKIQNYSMGLSDERYGIKLKKIDKINLTAALEIFKKEDHAFYKSLLKASRTSTITEFSKNNLVIPAYFNNFRSAKMLMVFMAINQTMPPTTNINISLSGASSDFLVEQNKFEDLFVDRFKQTNIKQIEIHLHGKKKSIIYPVNPDGTRSLNILAGYHISDASFLAINQQAVISGVSGDTSFELASMLSLPYYHSTNFHFKRGTYAALENICDLLDLPPQVKADFKIFFSYMELWNEGRDTSELTRVAGPKTLEELEDSFKKIDLQNMISHWHLFSDYLFNNFNFYSKLEDIILNIPVEDNKKHIESLNITNRAFKRFRA